MSTRESLSISKQAFNQPRLWHTVTAFAYNLPTTADLHPSAVGFPCLWLISLIIRAPPGTSDSTQEGTLRQRSPTDGKGLERTLNYPRRRARLIEEDGHCAKRTQLPEHLVRLALRHNHLCRICLEVDPPGIPFLFF